MSDGSSSLTGDQIVELCRRYTMYDWTAQSKANPIPVARAQGVYFWDVDGKRYLDLNSQLMSVNIGHGHPRVIEAIQRQAERLPFVSPLFAYEERALASGDDLHCVLMNPAPPEERPLLSTPFNCLARCMLENDDAFKELYEETVEKVSVCQDATRARQLGEGWYRRRTPGRDAG